MGQTTAGINKLQSWHHTPETESKINRQKVCN